MAMGLIEFFSLPNRQSEVVQLFLNNRQACRWRAKQLRHQQFTETLGASMLGGRGREAKIYVEDLELFEELGGEIKIHEERVKGIEKLIVALDVIIAKAGPLLDTVMPTPAGLRKGASDRIRRAYDEKIGLRDRAALAMGIDTFAPPTAEVENLTEVMAKDIARTNAAIAVYEKEAEILNGLYNECHELIEKSRDLLEPAEPVVEIKEVQPLQALEFHQSQVYQFIDDSPAAVASRKAAEREIIYHDGT